MDFLSGLTKLAKPEAEEKHQPSGDTATVPAGAGADRDHLIASAKVVAQAAQEAASRGTESVDKAKVAGAAADLLDAASKYTNIEGKSAGKLVDKAEEYLHQVQAGSGAGAGAHVAGGGGAADAPAAHPSKGAETADSGKAEGGGVGDVMKLAQGFFSTGQPGGQGTKEE